MNAVDYLLKPVDPARLELAVERARRRRRSSGDRARSQRPARDEIVQLVAERQSRRERLAIKVGERFLLVQADEIIYASLADDVDHGRDRASTRARRTTGRSTSCRRGSTRASSGACTDRIW